MRLAALLVAVAFLDELGSGVPFVAAPEIQREFGVSYGQAAGWLIFAMTALGVVVEPIFRPVAAGATAMLQSVNFAGSSWRTSTPSSSAPVSASQTSCSASTFV